MDSISQMSIDLKAAAPPLCKELDAEIVRTAIDEVGHYVGTVVDEYLDHGLVEEDAELESVLPFRKDVGYLNASDPDRLAVVADDDAVLTVVRPADAEAGEGRSGGFDTDVKLEGVATNVEYL